MGSMTSWSADWLPRPQHPSSCGPEERFDVNTEDRRQDALGLTKIELSDFQVCCA